MLFHNARYNESSQLVSLIVMLEHSILMPHCCVLCQRMELQAAVLFQHVIEIPSTHLSHSYTQKQESNHWPLMKGCCHLFCRSATIRAPCGSSDRLFFCITLNLRVQCINLTLLGETKEGPLLQYNNSARMETRLISATATCRNIITPAQHCCQHRKCM